MRFLTAELTFEKFSRSSEILFSYFFFHNHLFDNVPFQYSYVSFFFWVFWCFLVSPGLFFRHLSFPAYHRHFSMLKSIPICQNPFWLYILIICIRVSNSFEFFANNLMSSIFLLFYAFEFFQPALADGFFTGDKVTANFLRSPDLNNAVVWVVSTRPLIPSSPITVQTIWWLYRAHQLQLVSPSPKCYIVFSIL